MNVSKLKKYFKSRDLVEKPQKSEVLSSEKLSIHFNEHQENQQESESLGPEQLKQLKEYR